METIKLSLVHERIPEYSENNGITGALLCRHRVKKLFFKKLYFGGKAPMPIQVTYSPTKFDGAKKFYVRETEDIDMAQFQYTRPYQTIWHTLYGAAYHLVRDFPKNRDGSITVWVSIKKTLNYASKTRR